MRVFARENFFLINKNFKYKFIVFLDKVILYYIL